MRKNKGKLLLVVIVLVFAAMACGLPDFSQLAPMEKTAEEITQVPATEDTLPQESDSDSPPTSFIIPEEILLQDALVALYEAVSPGVVSIQVYSEIGSGVGSGFVIDKQGNIVTNYHVVQGASDVEVHFQSGLKVYGEVMGVDLDSDLAVIRVDVDPEFLYPLSLGDSDQVRVGQTVIAIGNPFGLSGTMTTGIVSARGRTLESIRQTEGGTFFSAGDLIQTDANINPGNSGGPLLNLNGEVIGINRAIQTNGSVLSTNPVNTGIGFAVSSNILRRVLPALKEGATYEYPYLGISALSSLSLSQAEFLALPQATGAYVLEVVPGGPSDLAGLRAGDQPTEVQGLFAGGDLIIRVDGREILEFSELLSYLMLNKAPGDEVTLTVLREGEEVEIIVVLSERP
jgi:2-alkenal reductase